MDATQCFRRVKCGGNTDRHLLAVTYLFHTQKSEHIRVRRTWRFFGMKSGVSRASGSGYIIKLTALVPPFMQQTLCY